MRVSNTHKSGAGREDTVQQYVGNYLGIVVQNNDPDKRGRVKVYIPHIAPSIYANWDETVKDKKFKFPGSNLDSDLNLIIDDLKEYLPWADCAAPLVGASGSGRYNANLKTGSISDSNVLASVTTDKQADDGPLNNDSIGEKPARQYEVNDYRLSDAFSTTENPYTGSNIGQPKNVNKYSHNYIPKSYSNSAKGAFSIPNVGSHVWVFFKAGNPMSPVYFAVSFGTEDWQAIYESEEGCHGKDYPGTYENKSDKEDPLYDHNTETYRNKYVLNQKGGTFEIVNTDNSEVLKMTHYSGSFKEFNNHTNIELATHNDQKLVLGHQFSTVRGTRSEHTDQDYDLIVRGDFYKKVGNFNRQAFSEWKDLVQQLADVKQRFEIKRAKYTQSENLLFQKVAPGSVVAGTFDNCPVCTHEGRMQYWEVQNAGLTFLNIPTVASTGDDLYGSYVHPRGDAAGGFEYIRPPKSSTNFLGSGNCPCCGGSGTSPSTQGGNFDSEDKDSIIKEQLHQIIGDLTIIEKDMGLGGSDISHITKHKVETIGLMMNDFPSVRIDDVGKINNNEVIVRRSGVFTSMRESPLVEYVHVDSLPGGDYTLNICNKFNCSVGAGGINFKTYGPVDIGGTITNIAGEQVNIMSENEVNIVSKRVNIVADILSLRQKKYKQVLVDSNLGVSQNVIIGGGLHVEGELTCSHITAPVEIQETEQTTVYARGVASKIVGYCQVGGGSSRGDWPVYGDGQEDSIKCYDHSHQFKNVPLHLMKTSDDVRSIAESNNDDIRNAPAPVENQCKGGGRGQTGETYSI